MESTRSGDRAGPVSCTTVTDGDEHYVGYSVLSLLEQVDEIVVVDFGNGDGTREIL